MTGNDPNIVISAVDQTKAAFASVTSGLKQIEGAATGLDAIAARVPMIGTALAAVMGGASFTGFVKNTIDAADAMNDMSQRTGIAVQELAAYKLVAEQSGTNMESIAKGAKGLATAMLEHGAALKQAGITATDTNGAMRQLADLIAGMPDGMVKMALVTKLLGKGIGMELIPMLNGGSAAMDKSAQASAKYATQMARMAPEADKFNDTMAEMSLNAKAVGIAIVNDLLPPLSKLAEQMAEAQRGGAGFFASLFAGLHTSDNAAKSLDDLRQRAASLQGTIAFLTQGGNIPDDPIFGGKLKTSIAELKLLQTEIAKRMTQVRGFQASVREMDNALAPKDGTRGKALADALGGSDKIAKTAKAVDELAVALDKIYAKDAKVDPSYMKDIGLLSAGLASGRLTASEYTEALFLLTAQQKFHTEALEAAKKLQQEWVEWQDKAQKALVSETATLEADVAKLRDHNREIGLTAEQMSALTLERIDSAIAAKEHSLAMLGETMQCTAESEALKDQIALLREKRGLTASGAGKEATAKAAKDSADEWKKFGDDIEKSLTDSIFRGLEKGGKEGAEVARDAITHTLNAIPIKLFAQAFIDPVMGTVRSTPGGQGSTSGAGATWNSNPFSTAAGSFATSSAGQRLGLSEAAYFDDAGVGSDMLQLTDAGKSLNSAANFLDKSAGYLNSIALAADGKWGSAAGSAIGMYFGGPIGSFIGEKIGSLLDGQGETRLGQDYAYGNAFDTRSQSYKDFGTADIARGAAPSGGAINDAQTAAIIGGTVGGINVLLASLGSKAVLTGFQAGLETSDKGRGGVYSGGTLSTGATFGETGAGSNYSGGKYENTSAKGGDAAATYANFVADTKQVTIEALMATADLPKTILGMLPKTYAEAEALTDSAASALLTSIGEVASGIAQFNTAADSMPFENLKNLSFDTAASLIQMAGGMDALGGKIAGYYESFYTADERAAQTTKNLTASFAAMNLALPASREGFRALVDAQDLATESGRKTYNALLNLSPAFASVVAAAKDTTGTAAEMTKALGDMNSATASLTTVVEDARTASLSTASAYLYQTETVRGLTASYDGSLVAAQALTGAMQSRYTTEMQLIQQVDGMIKAVSDSAAGSKDRFVLDTLDMAGKYDFYDQQMGSALSMISILSDPALIQQQADKYLNAQSAAWGLLDDGQKKTNLADFLADTDAMNAKVAERGVQLQTQIRDDNTILAEVIKRLPDLIREALTPVAASMQTAADTPLKLDMTLHGDGTATVETLHI